MSFKDGFGMWFRSRRKRKKGWWMEKKRAIHGEGSLFLTGQAGRQMWRGRFYVNWPAKHQVRVDIGPAAEMSEKEARRKLRSKVSEARDFECRINGVQMDRQARRIRCESSQVPAIPRVARGAFGELIACADLRQADALGTLTERGDRSFSHGPKTITK